MDLKEILSIPGKRGLYKLVSRGKNNIIVESFADGSRMPVFIAHQPSSLNDICILTYTENIPLEKVFKRIFQTRQGEKMPEDKIKDANELKNYMAEIVPDYDKDKVHVSDMKKLFSWYNILIENNLLSFDGLDEENVDHTEIKNETKDETEK